jgi:hypothetical protein
VLLIEILADNKLRRSSDAKKSETKDKCKEKKETTPTKKEADQKKEKNQ